MTTTKLHATQEEQLLPMHLPMKTREDLEQAAERRRWNEEQRERKFLIGLEQARDIFH